MPVDAHIAQLQQKHQALETKLADLTKTPSVSDVGLAMVKREKLKLKDEINRLNHA